MIQRKEGRGHKHADSLRAIGHSTIAVDLATRSKLKELAGDMPVSQYVKRLAFGVISPGGTPQTPFPGTEHDVSRNTLASLNSRFDALLKALGVPADKEIDMSWLNRPTKEVIYEALAEYRIRHPERSQDEQGNLFGRELSTP
jgi:hypothetical protein